MLLTAPRSSTAASASVRLAAVFVLLASLAAIGFDALYSDPPAGMDDLRTSFLMLGAASHVAQLVGLAWLALALVTAARAAAPSPSASDRRRPVSSPFSWIPAFAATTTPPVAAVVLLLLAVGAARLPLPGLVSTGLFAAALLTALVWGRSLVPAEVRTWVAPIVLVALAVRAAAAVALHVHGLSLGPTGVVLDDEAAYEFGALALLAVTSGSESSFAEWHSVHQHLDGHYLSLVAAVYGLLGPDALAVRLVGVGLGTATVLLGLLLANRLFGKPAAVATGLLLALFPSLVVWSTTILRESLIMALVMLVFWAALRWRSAPSWMLVVLVLAGLHVLVGLRPYVGLALTVLLLVALLVFHLRQRRLPELRAVEAGPVLTGVAAAAMVAWFFLPAFMDNLDPATLLYRRTVAQFSPPPASTDLTGVPGAKLPHHVGAIVSVAPADGEVEVPAIIVAERELSGGGAQPARNGQAEAEVGYLVVTYTNATIAVGPDQVRSIASMDPGVASEHLLRGLGGGFAAALFAPLSTGIPNLRYVLLAGDALLWLAVFGLALVGAARSRNAYLLLPLAFTAAVLLVLALVPGNPGNLVRHRAALTLPVLAVAAAPALAELARAIAASWAALRGRARLVGTRST